MADSDSEASKNDAARSSAGKSQNNEFQGDNEEIVVNKEIDEKWFASHNFLTWLTVLSFVLGIIAILPLIGMIFSDDVSRSVAFVLSVCVTLLVVVLLWAVTELRRNHRLKMEAKRDRAAHLAKIQEMREGRSVLERELRLQSELNRTKASIQQSIANIFRDIARRRAMHSTALYSLQAAILSLPIVDKKTFYPSWEQQQRFLEAYCSLSSQLFTTIKGAQCCTNIKVVWDATLWPEFRDLPFTEFGIDRSAVDAGKVAYKTVSRCLISSSNGRASGEQSERRELPENIILRRIFRGRYQHFISNDISADVDDWRERVRNREYGPFKFPDLETDKYYKSLLIVPLQIDVLGESSSEESSKKYHRFIGFLSIDAMDEGVQFDTNLDLVLASQIAFDLTSSFFEYFRCLRHLDHRLKA